VLSGPPRSGKTSFFGVFLEQLFMALDQCDLYKKTFVMIVNGDHLAAAAADPKLLHMKMVELTITSLVAQMPMLTPHQAMLQKYFDRIVHNDYLPLLPKRFLDAPETQGIAKVIVEFGTILSAHWHNRESGPEWASNLFLLPVLLPKELGFEDVLFVVDNFDSINIALEAGAQFDNGHLYLSEHFKNALTYTQFVLSYHDVQEFQNCLVSFDDDLVDFGLTLEYYSVLDINCEPDYSDYEITIAIGKGSIKISADHFGTAPGYLKQWNILNEICDSMDRVKDSPEDLEDCLAQAMNQAEKILPLVFCSDQGFGEIDDVRRRKIVRRDTGKFEL
jgi:hypothetical protein